MTQKKLQLATMTMMMMFVVLLLLPTPIHSSAIEQAIKIQLPAGVPMITSSTPIVLQSAELKQVYQARGPTSLLELRACLCLESD